MAKKPKKQPIDEMTAATENLIRDAEDELHRERMQIFWKQWGSTIIGMALMLIVGTGSGVAWREWQLAKNQNATSALLNVAAAPTTHITDDAVNNMGENHAAIAYLIQSGAIFDGDEKPETKQKKLRESFGAAGKVGDDTLWGWLGRWNALRLDMDDTKKDPNELLAAYDALADDMNKSALSALAYIDASLIAGERLQDPAKALTYIQKAKTIVPRTSSIMSVITDLEHLYEIRRQQNDKEKAG